MKHPIPGEALDDRLGFIGTSGSGKTYNAGTAVEILLSRKARVVIIDPLGVWWGLRLLADGKKPSHWNVAIFGGPHGDLPLTEHAGALIGETAATMAESCIIDLSELKSKSAERRFMVAFLETIYRKASGEPFHLIVDEADLFAPQKPSDGDQVLLGHMENIVRRGRIKGFIPWLISQRPAVLNKNVLSQVDGLLAFKLTGSQDRDALDSWIEGQADKSTGKAIKDALPALQIGQGVVWIPGRGVLDAGAKFPVKVTFDSSKTPKRGQKVTRRSLKPINLGKLKEQLATVDAESKANDPKALRTEIAALKAERDKLAKATTPAVKADPDAIKAAEDRGYVRGGKEMLKSFAKFKEAIEAHSARLGAAFATWTTVREDILRSAEQSMASQPTAPSPPGSHAGNDAPKRSTAPLAKPPAAKPITEASGDGNPAIEQKLLDALAELAALGVHDPARELVAMMARYSLHTNSVKSAIVALKNARSIEYGNGTLRLTAEGGAIANAAAAPRDAAEMRDRIFAILGEPADKLIIHLSSIYPEDCSREELASACGYSIHTNAVKSAIVKLKDMGFATYPGQGRVKADARLFP